MYLDRIIYILSNWPIYGIEFFMPYLVIFLGVKNYRYLNLGLKLLAGAFVFWAIVDLYIWHLAILEENNYWIGNIQEAGFSVLVIVSFAQHFKKKGFLIFIILFVVQVLVYFLPEQGYEKYMFYTVNRIIFLGYSIYFFFKTLEQMKIQNLLQYPWFWIFAGFLIYSASTVITYLLSEFTISVVSQQSRSHFFKDFNTFFSFILYIFITIGLYKAKGFDQLNGQN
ncbi:hypothetical protein SAMN06298216_1008 [Spirosomataceae bacterium TFI 002]|nr:hypothetical protein SAMN06298216_1008 [Spirosomataceae bacterium TFI 002]